MTRYFFDTDDGHTFLRDEEGCDLEDLEASRRLALEALSDIAGERLLEAEHRICRIHVRDRAGHMVYCASVELRGEWLA